MFLNFVIPQYSMSSVFTLDTVSINAVLNAVGTFQKAIRGNRGGKLSGEIFRLYKKDAEIKYTDIKAGKQYKRMAPVVHVDAVEFSQYEAKFRSQIPSDAWETLMSWRESYFSFSAPQHNVLAASPQPAVPLIEGDDEDAAPPPALTGSVVSNAAADEEAQRARAEDPAVAPLFAELAELLGRENTPHARFATAGGVSSVQQLADYLQKKIAAEKKKKAPAAKVEKAAPATQAAPPAAAAGGEQVLF
jgi:hypothetical protein